MPIQVTVIYPASSSSTFNMDYYLSTHMPLVQKLWGPAGLKNWTVLKFGADAPYSVQATLFWDSMADFENAGKDQENTGKIMGDIKNFSNVDPVLMPGEVVGSA